MKEHLESLVKIMKSVLVPSLGHPGALGLINASSRDETKKKEDEKEAKSPPKSGFSRADESYLIEICQGLEEDVANDWTNFWEWTKKNHPDKALNALVNLGYTGQRNVEIAQNIIRKIAGYETNERRLKAAESYGVTANSNEMLVNVWLKKITNLFSSPEGEANPLVNAITKDFAEMTNQATLNPADRKARHQARKANRKQLMDDLLKDMTKTK